jgi:hypothetical protein
VRVVGITADPSVAVAQAWLERAQEAGADAVLVARLSADAGAVRTRLVSRLGPLAVIRALDAEDQLRPIDVVVAFGRRGRLLLRALPAALRGHMRGVTQETAPQAVNWREREERDPNP